MIFIFTLLKQNTIVFPKTNKQPEMVSKMIIIWILLSLFSLHLITAQDYDDGGDTPASPPPEANNCNGIFLTYTFTSRTKEYPHIKNATAQPWAFKSMATILNAGMDELKNWKMFIGFHNREILVSASNAIILDGDDFPAPVGNGTTIAGYPQTDLLTSIDTAGDYTQIQARVEFTGTQFGIRPLGYPMPRTIKLVNDGYKCPAARRRATNMYVCCVKDPKFKAKNLTTKYLPRQNGDLLIAYDILQVFGNNYQAQVTIYNSNPLGRLDNWNLTWEWMRGEFIYSMKGAYTHMKDFADCIYGPAGQYYQDMDFSKVMNCEKKPIISDLPPDRATDKEIGYVPYCCRNGTLLPTTMNATQAMSIFQLQVFKLPPDLNRTALNPPSNWKIIGVLNPQYKCGQALRVDEAQFPDPSGLQAITTAVASWQVVCNITRPKPKQARCCVSYSSYYNDSVIPCNTCACGCDDSTRCNQNAHALLLPPEALLVPFANRMEKAIYWAKMKHFRVGRPLPCPDNCGVSINWHLSSNYRTGWSARVTLFNWKDIPFVNWFLAVQLKRTGAGFERAYSFNGTLLKDVNNTVFITGLPGLKYLIGQTNGSNPETDPPVPGKQQSVLSFTKKKLHNVRIVDGDGFPTKVFFNGEECALPTHLPTADATRRSLSPMFFSFTLIVVQLVTNHLFR